MWRSVSRSSAALLVGLAAATGTPAAETLEQALVRLFPPPGRLTQQALELSAEQARRVAAEAGAPLPSRTLTRYVGREGTVYVDTHLVRTAPETLLIVVDPAGKVARVEVLAFEEPREYLPSRRWFAQFEGRALEPELNLRRGIRALSGASLSSEAATDAVRRALAVQRVVPP
ncbi:MAG TPA: FMN-binding protein [Candidatus Polarisedimenticolaceae bacterium]|nr:FMN-binding protein [Candidatus Polarisedimenticolaceae bacterium]